MNPPNYCLDLTNIKARSLGEFSKEVSDKYLKKLIVSSRPVVAFLVTEEQWDNINCWFGLNNVIWNGMFLGVPVLIKVTGE